MNRTMQHIRSRLCTRALPMVLLPALLLAGCGDRELTTAAAPVDGRQVNTSSVLTGSPNIVISQVYGGGGNSGAPYTHDYVELFNRGTTAVSLAGWSVQYASATGTGNFASNSITALTGELAPGQYYLVQLAGGTTGTALPTAQATGTTNMSATGGKVVLVDQVAGLGCNGGSTPCSPEQLARIADLVGYGSANFFEGSGAAPAPNSATAVFREGSGCTDTDNNAGDFATNGPAPRNTATALNPCTGGGTEPEDPPVGGEICTAEHTPAYEIQGSGMASLLVGQPVTTRGVVVGDYEGASPALRGFYLQDVVGDNDPATSDGIFVFNGTNNDVNLGDVVSVTGTVGEFQDQTQISNVTSLTVCGTGTSMTPVAVTLPFADATYLERFEGMLVRLPQTLTVTEHFQLGRFGQVVMSSGGRLMQPTQIAAPGSAALAVQAANDLNRIIIDDAENGQNPEPILFGRGGNPLSASNTLRAGDQATGIVGVLTYTWAGNAASGNAYRVRPIDSLGGGVPNFVAANPRPAAPAPIGGTLKVAAMNLLNYFNNFGGGCGNPEGGTSTGCRGADNAAEFERQWQKTVAAILAMNVDVLGVIEVENDGYGPESAIADLVNKLNDRAGAGTYAFIDADSASGQLNALGTDAIKNGLIYKPATVKPIGTTAVLNSDAFVNGGDNFPRNRPSLAQAFVQVSNGSRVIVSVNHLKSKGSACNGPDAGDGQGNCNAVRTRAANELLAWLATDPTQTSEANVLIVGDLNSYAKEDPIRALIGGGFTDLAQARIGSGTYSYAFDGQWGTLDYALASASLASQVTGITKWHINADEPSVLDYNTNFKTSGQQMSLYSPDPYRVADHDPVIVGLQLRPGQSGSTPRR